MQRQNSLQTNGRGSASILWEQFHGRKAGQGVSLMKNNASGWIIRTFIFGAMATAGLFGVCGSTVAQEKRTIFKDENFHWQGEIGPGRNPQIRGRHTEN